MDPHRNDETPSRLNNGTNSFSFRLENGVATATVNGAEVFRNAALPAKVNVPEGEFRVGLGAHSYQNVTLILSAIATCRCAACKKPSSPQAKS